MLGNVENEYSQQLFFIENRLYEFDQEIQKLNYFISAIDKKVETQKWVNSLKNLRGLFKFYKESESVEKFYSLLCTKVL